MPSTNGQCLYWWVGYLFRSASLCLINTLSMHLSPPWLPSNFWDLMVWLGAYCRFGMPAYDYSVTWGRTDLGYSGFLNHLGCLKYRFWVWGNAFFVSRWMREGRWILTARQIFPANRIGIVHYNLLNHTWVRAWLAICCDKLWLFCLHVVRCGGFGGGTGGAGCGVLTLLATSAIGN